MDGTLEQLLLEEHLGCWALLRDELARRWRLLAFVEYDADLVVSEDGGFMALPLVGET